MASSQPLAQGIAKRRNDNIVPFKEVNEGRIPIGLRPKGSKQFKTNRITEAMFADIQNHYDYHLVKTASDLIINGALDGIMKVTHRGELKISKTMSELQGKAFHDVSKEVIRCYHKWGFVAYRVIEDHKLGRTIRVLDLSSGHELRYFINDNSEFIPSLYRRKAGTVGNDIGDIMGFAISVPPLMGGTLDQGMTGWERVEDVYFEVEYKPLSTGQLTSPVYTIKSIIDYHHALEAVELSVWGKLALPPIVTENTSANIGQLGAAMRMEWDLKDEGTLSRRNKTPAYHTLQSYPSYDMATKIDMQRRLSEQSQELTNTLGHASKEAARREINRLLYQTLPKSSVNLPQDRKLVHQVLPQPPSDMTERRLKLQQDVLTVFQIPPHKIQAESTQGRLHHDASVEDTWFSTVRRWQHTVCATAEAMWNNAWQEEELAMGTLTADLKPKPGMSDDYYISQIVKHTGVTVSIVSMQSQQRLHDLWKDGTLIRGEYIRQLSEAIGLPEESFEKEPGLSRMDLLTTGRYSITEMQIKAADRQAKESHKFEAEEADKDRENDAEEEKSYAKAKPKPKAKAKKKTPYSKK